ncbi:MAG: Mur ligase family protein, partial [Bifidobacterium sp.]|nr:Mur ligase family protein [Bifidobacterium sp.]
MALTMASALELLRKHDQLREVIQGDRWTLDQPADHHLLKPFTDVTYDTRQAGPGSLLFCKGHFLPEYMDACGPEGPAAYVAQQDLSARTSAPGIIVNDVRKSMSLLSAAFYGYPQNQLTLVGITGTKGKTTTAYYLHAMLGELSGGRAALFSSVDNCLDGRHYVESQLTTPESLDLFRMMRQAVDDGMRYLVMEVSSQAYKVDRVYGLTFDLGAFLNIS